MSPAEVVSSRASVPPSGERPLAVVIETMNRWLDGEPVWPYAKIIDVWGTDFEMYRKTWRTPPFEKTLSLMRTRDAWIKNFGFAIPCAELLDALDVAHAASVVEVGAGSGYMTKLMRNRGINVVGSDYGSERFCPTFVHGLYDHQQVNAQAKTIVRRHRDSTVFCSWPSLDRTWFRQMLRAMRVGQRLIAIREDSCAEDSAWEYLDDCFEREAIIDIPTFPYMNDLALVHIKKRQHAR